MSKTEALVSSAPCGGQSRSLACKRRQQASTSGVDANCLSIASVSQRLQHARSALVPDLPERSWPCAGVFDGTKPVSRQAPWMSGMFVGQVDRNESNVYPGFIPIRDPKAKW